MNTPASTTPKCTSMFGHDFEARYDQTGPQMSPEVKEVILKFDMDNTYDEPTDILAACAGETYVRDICVNCGVTVERIK